MNNHSVTLVINSRKQPLAPTLRTDFIRKKLKRGLAKILFRFRRNIRVVMLLEKKYLNRKIVTWNRNKKIGQTKDSFKEYIEKNPNKYNLIVKFGKRVYRNDWTKVYHGKFKDIPSNLIDKGAIVIYKDSDNRVKKRVDFRFSSSEYKIYLYPKGYIGIRNFIGIVRRGSITPVF